MRTLIHPERTAEDLNVLDSSALVLYFPAPKTVTGEDVLELHVHGGRATVKAVLAAIPECKVAGGRRTRYAEPGEFSKRAFLNDRLDLAQVEALGDALDAETEHQRRAAVRGNSGALGRTYESWREQLLLARGEIEALIDFSEDQHFDEPASKLLSNVSTQVADILQGIALHEIGSERSELLRSGIRIALVGPPNAGKSSLLNLIVGREAAIVSGEAGTTRDVIEASLDMRGYLCSFADTAGFRSVEGAVGAVEAEGIRRARQKAQESDVVIVLASVEQGPSGPFLSYDTETLDLAAAADESLLVVNKRDAVDDTTLAALVSQLERDVHDSHPLLAQRRRVATISCKQLTQTDQGGVHGLIDQLVGTFAEMTDMPPDMRDLLGVTERQRQLLDKCRRHLREFMHEAVSEDDGVEPDTVLAAEYLRYAADCLARITGRGDAGDVEEVLGVVFEK